MLATLVDSRMSVLYGAVWDELGYAFEDFASHGRQRHQY
jgi:hypothetical protein